MPIEIIASAKEEQCGNGDTAEVLKRTQLGVKIHIPKKEDEVQPPSQTGALNTARPSESTAAKSRRYPPFQPLGSMHSVLNLKVRLHKINDFAARYGLPSVPDGQSTLPPTKTPTAATNDAPGGNTQSHETEEEVEVRDIAKQKLTHQYLQEFHCEQSAMDEGNTDAVPPSQDTHLGAYVSALRQHRTKCASSGRTGRQGMDTLVQEISSAECEARHTRLGISRPTAESTDNLKVALWIFKNIDHLTTEEPLQLMCRDFGVKIASKRRGTTISKAGNASKSDAESHDSESRSYSYAKTKQPKLKPARALDLGTKLDQVLSRSVAMPPRGRKGSYHRGTGTPSVSSSGTTATDGRCQAPSRSLVPARPSNPARFTARARATAHQQAKRRPTPPEMEGAPSNSSDASAPQTKQCRGNGANKHRTLSLRHVENLVRSASKTTNEHVTRLGHAIHNFAVDQQRTDADLLKRIEIMNHHRTRSLGLKEKAFKDLTLDAMALREQAMGDIQRLNRTAANELEEGRYERIVRNRWFADLLGVFKTRSNLDFHRLRNFLFALYYVLVIEGLPLTKEIVFHLILLALRPKDLKRRAAVRVLRHLLEQFKIAPGELLAWLDENNVPPPSYLVNEVRHMEERNKERAQRRASRKPSLFGAAPMPSPASSVAVSPAPPQERLASFSSPAREPQATVEKRRRRGLSEDEYNAENSDTSEERPFHAGASLNRRTLRTTMESEFSMDEQLEDYESR